MKTPRSVIVYALSMAIAPAWAQDHSHHNAPPPEPKAAATHDHATTDHAVHQTPAVDHSAMGHAMPQEAPSQEAPIEPVPPVTDADRAAAFPDIAHGMHHAPERNSFVVFDRLEAMDLDHGRGEAWEAQAWIGSDLNRLWLRSEGEREHGHTEAADLEVLYGRSVSAWWDVVAGVKHDFKPGKSRDWAAFGVQGLAPYKFEVSATAYVGESGATAATVEAEYEVLLTNRLILQPRVEVEAFGKDDPARGIGSGLSTVEAGLRLRYEFTRQFAPYVGVAWERAYGGTADLRRDEGETVEDTRLVAGVRFWF
ncbi:copper resistance protein B [Lysobacter arvi]|uniref:Copper resistance protein B n=1 Tax=Lysobacter arvi TaxID=3038776 RepID=A0ABU1CAG0_9GAMM|nr:copper resistance protein B [Lysobacter arvi]MDR0182179.1 copper resistance protein B [Lysobacter arvi]